MLFRSVGYDLYLKLLEEAVMEEKGETPPQRVECAADLTLSANLPSAYVSDPGQRVDLYRRIAAIRSEDSRSDLLDELIDRYGEPPKEAVASVSYTHLLPPCVWIPSSIPCPNSRRRRS